MWAGGTKNPKGKVTYRKDEKKTRQKEKGKNYLSKGGRWKTIHQKDENCKKKLEESRRNVQIRRGRRRILIGMRRW